jgi:hypothetical protein
VYDYSTRGYTEQQDVRSFKLDKGRREQEWGGLMLLPPVWDNYGITYILPLRKPRYPPDLVEQCR